MFKFSVSAAIPEGCAMIAGTPKPVILALGQAEPTLDQIVEAYRGQVVILQNLNDPQTP